MPLPQQYKVLKIHPSIGVARLSTNEDFFIYGEPTTSFKSNNLIKRQAVRFRIFAYGANNAGIEELTPARLTELGITARWRARVANHKIAMIRGDDVFVIRAEATSDVNDGTLIGSLAQFPNANQIPLGQITNTGLFIPPMTKIYRADPAAPFPTSGLRNKDTSDNTSDGFVTVELTDNATGQPVGLPIFGSWILVTPPDFAPDTDDDETTSSVQQRTLEQYLVAGLHLPNLTPATPVNQAAREIDRDMMRRCTGDFQPGIEASLNNSNITQFAANLLPPVETGDPDEVRIAFDQFGNAAGASPGELTSGLCSPWQFDFQACTCGFWPAQRPDTALRDATTPVTVNWRRKKVADVGGGAAGLLTTKKDFVDHVHELGILREQNGRVIETERTNDIA
jgi:L-Lysine epsilon oxidase N-terminal/L-lysine epsilon oxidase C-terminal domain